MITDLLPWIEDGLTIRKRSEGDYQVFTVPTQHFDVKSLDEITPDRLKFEVNKQTFYQELLEKYYELKH